MNIFTRFLSQWSTNKPLSEFVARWDTIEGIVVKVYRRGQATVEDEAIFAETRAWLLVAYNMWANRLRPFWQNSKVGGKLGHEDPFFFLLQHKKAADFCDNWAAMQHLPAAREALNGLIIEVTKAE